MCLAAHDFLHDNNILMPDQFGFRVKHFIQHNTTASYCGILNEKLQSEETSCRHFLRYCQGLCQSLACNLHLQINSLNVPFNLDVSKTFPSAIILFTFAVITPYLLSMLSFQASFKLLFLNQRLSTYF